MKFEMIGDRCLVKVLKAKGATDTGIILPGADKQKTDQGVVISVGPGAMLEDGRVIPMAVKPGDRVLFSTFSGIPVKEKENDDDEYLILLGRDLYCTVE